MEEKMADLNPILALCIGLFVGIVAILIINFLRNKNVDRNANKIIEDAKKEADKHRRDALLELKEESYKLKQELDAEIREKKAESKEAESRLLSRENNLDKREETLQKRDQMLDEKENSLMKKQKEVQEKEAKMDELIKQELTELEKISGMSKDKAKELIMKKLESTMEREMTEYIKEQEAEAKLVDDKTVQVEVPHGVGDVLELRYLWADSPAPVNLYSRNQLPAAPFRIVNKQ